MKQGCVELASELISDMRLAAISVHGPKSIRPDYRVCSFNAMRAVVYKLCFRHITCLVVSLCNAVLPVDMNSFIL